MMPKLVLTLALIMAIMNMSALATGSTSTTAGATTTTAGATTTTAGATTTTAGATTTTAGATTTTAGATTTTAGATTTTAGATTTTAGATTTTAGATTTTGAATTTTTGAENTTETTTKFIARAYTKEPMPAGTQHAVVDTSEAQDFNEGDDVVVGPGTPQMEFNKIERFERRLGNSPARQLATTKIKFATPLINHHPAGTKIAGKQVSDTTTNGGTTSKTTANPCVVVTTTNANPCAVAATTTAKDPCAPAKKFVVSDGPSAGHKIQKQPSADGTVVMVGYGLGGLVAVVALAVRGSQSFRAHPYAQMPEVPADADDLELHMVGALE